MVSAVLRSQRCDLPGRPCSLSAAALRPPWSGTFRPDDPTTSGNDVSFNEEFNGDVPTEPADWVEPDTVGLGVAIGIRERKPFEPDDRIKRAT